MNLSRRILGVDPGSHRLGIGCIEAHGNSLTLLKADVLLARRDAHLYDRLEHLSHLFRKLLDELGPAEVAIEDTFFAKNARSAFHLGLARGIIMNHCFGREIQIFEYTPTQVKSAVTGYGRADKSQVQKMIRLLFGRDIPEWDATDAVAVAMCHIQSYRLTKILQEQKVEASRS